MARWTLAGSVGVAAAPLLVIAAVAIGAGWRHVFVALGVAGTGLLLLIGRLPVSAGAGDEHLWATVRATLGLLRRRDVVRWLLLLQAADLMLDVLHGFLALYLVDVAHAQPAEAALGVAVWTGAGLVGDAALLLVLRHVPGLRYLRWSAFLVALVYPVFLLAPALPPKLAALAALGIPQRRLVCVAQRAAVRGGGRAHRSGARARDRRGSRRQHRAARHRPPRGSGRARHGPLDPSRRTDPAARRSTSRASRRGRRKGVVGSVDSWSSSSTATASSARKA